MGTSIKEIASALIQKGGEGSRGGHIIGHTKSGKPIYDQYKNSAHNALSQKDHLEASKLHDKFAKEARKDKKYVTAVKHDKHSKRHFDENTRIGYSTRPEDKSKKPTKKGNESKLKEAEENLKHAPTGYRDEYQKKVDDLKGKSIKKGMSSLELLDELIEKGNSLKGGIGDSTKKKDVDSAQLKMGIRVEMEHTDDKKVAEEIAIDHLSETKDYYSKLKKVEKH